MEEDLNNRIDILNNLMIRYNTNEDLVKILKGEIFFLEELLRTPHIGLLG